MLGWINVASIFRVKSRNEGFVLRSKAGPFVFTPGLRVSFVPPALDCVRGATVREVSVLSEREVCVQFAEPEVASCASELVGMDVLVSAEDVPELFDDEETDVLGWLVTDERFGVLGRVEEVLEGPAQDLLVVVPEVAAAEIAEADVAPAHATGTAKVAGGAKAAPKAAFASEILIPYVDAFISSYDDATRTLYVHIPAGLLTLGAN